MAGVPEEQANGFRRLSADDNRPDDRMNCLRDSYNKRRLGLPVAGPSRLREYLPRDDMDTLERMLPTQSRVIRIVPLVRGRRPIVDLSGAEAGHAR